MSSFLWCSLLYMLALISTIDGLNCMVCSSATNTACLDPSSGDQSTSSSLSQPGFISCLKTMYWAGLGSYSTSFVTREGSQQTCSWASSTGTIATVYCCSDKDNCNGATVHPALVFVTISLLICSLFAK